MRRRGFRTMLVWGVWRASFRAVQKWNWGRNALAAARGRTGEPYMFGSTGNRWDLFALHRYIDENERRSTTIVLKTVGKARSLCSTVKGCYSIRKRMLSTNNAPEDIGKAPLSSCVVRDMSRKRQSINPSQNNLPSLWKGSGPRKGYMNSK